MQNSLRVHAVNFGVLGLSLSQLKEGLQVSLLAASLVMTVVTIYFKIKNRGRSSPD